MCFGSTSTVGRRHSWTHSTTSWWSGGSSSSSGCWLTSRGSWCGRSRPPSPTQSTRVMTRGCGGKTSPGSRSRAWSSRRSCSSLPIRPGSRSWEHACPRACSCTGRRAPARRCWPRPSPVSRGQTSISRAPRRSSRCGRGWAPRGFASCLRPPARTSPRSSSSTSWTRSDQNGSAAATTVSTTRR